MSHAWVLQPFQNSHTIWQYILPPKLTGPMYFIFLQQVLRVLLNAVPLNVCQGICFQHYGVPPHFSLNVWEHIYWRFRQGPIGQSEPIEWPPQSPDYITWDFFCVGLYAKFDLQDSGRNRRVSAGMSCDWCKTDEETPDVMERIYQSIVHRYNGCNDDGSCHTGPEL